MAKLYLLIFIVILLSLLYIGAKLSKPNKKDLDISKKTCDEVIKNFEEEMKSLEKEVEAGVKDAEEKRTKCSAELERFKEYRKKFK